MLLKFVLNSFCHLNKKEDKLSFCIIPNEPINNLEITK